MHPPHFSDKETEVREGNLPVSHLHLHSCWDPRRREAGCADSCPATSTSSSSQRAVCCVLSDTPPVYTYGSEMGFTPLWFKRCPSPGSILPTGCLGDGSMVAWPPWSLFKRPMSTPPKLAFSHLWARVALSPILELDVTCSQGTSRILKVAADGIGVLLRPKGNPSYRDEIVRPGVEGKGSSSRAYSRRVAGRRYVRKTLVQEYY